MPIISLPKDRRIFSYTLKVMDTEPAIEVMVTILTAFGISQAAYLDYAGVTRTMWHNWKHGSVPARDSWARATERFSELIADRIEALGFDIEV